MLHMSPMKGAAATRSFSDPLSGSVEALADENVDLKRKVDLLMRKLSDQKLQQKVHPALPPTRQKPWGRGGSTVQRPSSALPPLPTHLHRRPTGSLHPTLARDRTARAEDGEKVLPTLVSVGTRAVLSSHTAAGRGQGLDQGAQMRIHVQVPPVQRRLLLALLGPALLQVQAPVNPLTLSC